ncbi:ChaC-like protein [Auriculariales sp. MPI-PUGE-AT-0066]|nr:ChaC-like protein [Auriculariales sp. MPI-PUGE-AT-0066]
MASSISSAGDGPPQPYRVFGYGSLIFKPPPNVVNRSEQRRPYLQLELAAYSDSSWYIKGYVRRFAQSSTDHRGTPEAPGRVVTLIPVNEWESLYGHETFPGHDVVWGVVYEINPDPLLSRETFDYLEYREKEGYTVHIEDVYAAGGSVITEGAVVRAQSKSFSPTNVGKKLQLHAFGSLDGGETKLLSLRLHIVGAEPLDQLAAHIWRSVGPSGPNKDYLFGIARAVRELAPDSDDPYLFELERIILEMDQS